MVSSTVHADGWRGTGAATVVTGAGRITGAPLTLLTFRWPAARLGYGISRARGIPRTYCRPTAAVFRSRDFGVGSMNKLESSYGKHTFEVWLVS
jgi:hypothetical protein